MQAHCPTTGKKIQIFMEIQSKAKKTLRGNSRSHFSNPYFSDNLDFHTREVEVRGHDKPSAQYSRFLKMFKQLRLEIGLKDALVEMPKFNKWLSSLLRNKEKLEEIAITTVNAECSAIIMNKVPEKLEDPGKFLIPCALQELDRTSALADSGASINLLPHSIYKKLGLEALTPTRMTLELANRSISHPMGIAEDVVVRVDGFTFLADFVKLTLRVGKDELVYYADKSEKNKDKNCVHAISIIDFSKEDPFSGSTTNSLHPSSSPVKTSDNIEKFTDELAPLDSLPSGNDDSTLKKEFHEVRFQVTQSSLFEFDESFRSSNMNPLFEENNKDVEIKSSSSSTLTSPEASELEDYLEKDSIPPGIDLTLPTTLEVLSSNPTFPTLTKEKVCAWETPMFFHSPDLCRKNDDSIAIRKKIMCILGQLTYIKKQTSFLKSEEIKENEKEVSSIVPIDTIVMPIRITFDNPIDFNDHFSKPKDLKKDLTISFDSTTTSILPHPSLDSDSPFTAELSASVTLNSLGNEDKVFKPGSNQFGTNQFGVKYSLFSGFWKIHGSILWKNKAIPTISIDDLQSSLHKWSDELGRLVGKLVSSAITFGRCKAYEQVARIKEPFDLSKVKGYRPSYEKEHTQANNDLSTATFSWLNEYVADASAFVEALLLKKPPHSTEACSFEDPDACAFFPASYSIFCSFFEAHVSSC
ncbi:reverse transcriptase domain-containing protein [Tanacetum coccineum]